MRKILIYLLLFELVGIFAYASLYSQFHPPLNNTLHQAADVPSVKEIEGHADQQFLNQHNAYIKRGQQGPVDLLFIGDSITYRWQKNPSWSEFFSAYRVANFGINGDYTQNVLWRIQYGELDAISPKVVVLLIGTNNTKNSVGETVRGIKKIIETIQQKLPHAKIILMGLFPRGSDAQELSTVKNRAKNYAVNREISKWDNGITIRYLDIGDKFLDMYGNIPPDIMEDGLHPTDKGYRLWAAALLPLLQSMMAQ